jgi:hypothetical protein
MDDRVAIEITDEFDDALHQLVCRVDKHVAEHGARRFGEKPSTRLSQEPCLGVNTKAKRPSG